MEEIVALTKQLVQIDSSDPGAYENEIGLFIENWLKNAIGAEITKEEVLPGRNNIRAKITGKQHHPTLTYICHMDTVTLGEGWKESPLSGKLKDGRIYGRGSCDMKSGLACAMLTFRDICQKKAAGKVPRHDFQLIATVDEEDFMRGAEKVIQSKWVTAEDWVMDTEPTDGKIRVAHKGRTWFELTVQGITAHASTPYKGADAILALSEMIVRIKSYINSLPIHKELGESTVTFGMIEGGYRPYVVPDHSKVWIDMRLAPPATTEKVATEIKKIIKEVSQNIPGISGKYEITGDRKPVEKNPESPLLKALIRADEIVTDKSAQVDIFPGYTDTAVIASNLGNPHCMSYGPGNLELAHKPNEYVPVADILRCYQVLCLLTNNLLLTKEK